MSLDAGTQPPSCSSAEAAGDRGWRILTIAFTLVSISTVAVGLRFTSRRISKAGYWLDDLVILIPLTCALAYSFSTIPLYLKGVGKHYTCADSDAIPFFLKTLLAWEFLYTVIIAGCKYSILLFLYRLFRHAKSFKAWFWIFFVVITMWAIAVILVSAMSCIPLHAFWGEGSGTCVSTKSFFVGNSVPNIVTDIGLLILPIPYITSLHTTRSYKIALMAVFACGAFVTVISCVRLNILLTTGTGPDVTWEDAPEAEWTMIEENIAILCACLPSFGPLLKILLRKLNLDSSAPWSKRFNVGGLQGDNGEISSNSALESGSKSSASGAGFVELRDLEGRHIKATRD